MELTGNCCFFAHESREQLLKEQYTLSDINILRELGFNVIISTCYKEVPYNSDLYYSWWASGSILPLIKARVSKKPIIVVAGGQEAMLTCDSLSGIAYGYLSTPLYKKLATRICLRYGSRILVVSNHMIMHVKMLGARSPIVVHNCVDTETFNLAGLSRNYVTMMFRSDEAVLSLKRGEIFIRAIPIVLKSYPNQRFIVIGEKGNAYQRIQELIGYLRIERNIEFTGSLSNKKVSELLNRSTVYVQISESETFGVAIAEAMACGTPVVVSQKGAIPEIVDNNGIYVDNNNPDSVAAGIIELLRKSTKERDEIGMKSRKRIVDNFSYIHRKNALRHIIINL